MDMEPASNPVANGPVPVPMTGDAPRRYDRLLRALVTMGLAAFALLYVWHAYRLILYPGDVDNIEGFVLYQGQRYAEGQGNYPPLTSEPPFLVDTYPPAYPLVIALGYKLGFQGFFWSRLVSSLSIAGVAGVIFMLIYGRTERIWPALLAALLLPATYHIYHWGSLARVDSFGLFLTAVALLLADREKLPWLAALIFSLTTFTKPNFVAGPIAAFFCGILREKRKEASLYFLLYLAFTIALYGVLHHWTDGNSTLQILVFNANEFRLTDILINFRWWFLHCWVHSALALAYLLECRRKRRNDLVSVYLVLAGIVALSVGKIGSGPNYFFEVVLATCLCVGLLLAESMEADAERQMVPVYQSPLLIACLLFVQLLGTVHWPGGMGIFGWAWSPTREERLECRKLERFYRDAVGPVLAERPGVALAAGHKPWWQPFICTQLNNQGLWDETPVLEALRSSRFSVVGMVNGGDLDQMNDAVRNALKEHYTPLGVMAQTVLYVSQTDSPTRTPARTPTRVPMFTPTPTRTPHPTHTATTTPPGY